MRVHAPRVPLQGRLDRKQQDALWLLRLDQEGVGSLIATEPKEPPQLTKGIQEFNEEMFFECHETLENLWRVTPYPLRLFYQGVIKAAVGFLHTTRRNRKGGINLMHGAQIALRPFGPQFMNVDTQALLLHLARWEESLSAGTPWDEVLSNSFPKITRLTKVP